MWLKSSLIKRTELILLSIFLAGCLPGCLPGCLLEPQSESTYLTLNYGGKERLPLSPHVHAVRARPTLAMIEENPGTFLRFLVLDKRTLAIHPLVATVGSRRLAPWGGALYPVAFVSDLVIREGEAVHGPQGHFNPAVWVLLEDENAKLLHEGWMFARDSTQTAWDHPRYDLIFLGTTDTAPKESRADIVHISPIAD